ncbi:hypothetical protein [Aminipila sp.]|uniref:hypothetical protein n=1 Tax=Aminipila sp. TaxID=2060095 RepID=UPI0028A14592|nr:hypothetical protein [Aminipila sp.]
MTAKKLKPEQKNREANENFRQLFKLGLYKQLYTDGFITEKQYKSILLKYKMS